MGKGKKVVSRLLGTILTLVFSLCAMLLFIVLGVVTTYSAEVSLLGHTTTYVVAVMVTAVFAIFGGKESDVKSLSYLFIDGEQQGDPTEISLGELSFNLDYFALIALILAIVGLVLFLVFYRNKLLAFIGGALSFVAAILGGFQSLTFGFVNPDFVEVFNTIGKYTGGSITYIGVGGICFAVILGLTSIWMMIHAAKIKK